MRMRSVLAGLLAIPVLMAAEATPPAGWKEFSPKDKSFSVWLPEKSGRRSERERTMTIRGQRIKINLVVVEVRGGPTYEASTFLLSAKMARGIPTKEKLQIIRDAYLDEVKGKVTAESDITIGEAMGKEYTIQTGRGMARLRAFARLGRFYRAAVSGSNAQVAGKDADTFLDSFKLSGKAPDTPAETPAGKDKEEAAGKGGAAVPRWIANVSKMKIPDAAVEGKLGGSDFKVDNAKFNSALGMLVLEKGRAEAEIKIFLGIPRGEKLDGKTYKLNAQGAIGEQRPHIHFRVKSPGGRGKAGASAGDYAMLLEFGKEEKGKIPGKIYLCLSDEDKSVVAGTFTAKRE